MDDLRLAAALSAVATTERAVRYWVDETDSPAEKALGWVAYRNAVGLRKALEKWIESRVYRASHPAADAS